MKNTLGEILYALSHNIDAENSIVFTYGSYFSGSFATFLHDVLEDRHMMMSRGKRPNGTWEIEFLGFENVRKHGEMAEFVLRCHKPKFPDESFLYGCEIGILAKMKKPR